MSRRPKRDFEYAPYRTEPTSLAPKDWIDDCSLPADYHAKIESKDRRRREYENPEDLLTILDPNNPEKAVDRIVSYKNIVGKVVSICPKTDKLTIAPIGGRTKTFDLAFILREQGTP